MVGFRRFLQARGHFARMIRCNPSIIRARHHQDRGIFRSINNMMVRRIGVERLELLRIFYRPELGDIKGSVGRKLDAQHIVNAH